MKKNEEFAKRFKWVRNEFLNLTQKEMAERLGIDRSLLSVIETGRQKASSTFLQKMFDVFQINPTWLLTGSGSVGDKNSHFNSVVESHTISESSVAYGDGLEVRLASQAKTGGVLLNLRAGDNSLPGQYGYVGLSSSQVRKKALSDEAIHNSALYRIVEVDQLWIAFHIDGWEFEILRGYFEFGGDRTPVEWSESIRFLRWMRECINLAY